MKPAVIAKKPRVTATKMRSPMFATCALEYLSPLRSVPASRERKRGR